MTQYVRALVTGASAGLGVEFARQLAADGTDLVLVARTEDAMREHATELERDHAVKVEVMRADLTDDTDLGQVAGRIEADPPIDLVINNAGFGTVGRFDGLDVERELGLVDLNVRAVVRLTHAAVTTLVPRRSGGILNVSSMAAYQPIPNFATYAASKAFVTSFTQAVHEELKHTGVHVTVLAPGFTRTNFVEAAQAEREASRLPDVLWMEPGPVVAAGLRGIRRNRATVVPGLANQVTATVADFTPTTITRRVAALGRRLSS